MSGNVYHTVKSGTHQWSVKGENSQKAYRNFRTQAEAIECSKEVARNQNGSIQIHKRDGDFRKQHYNKS
ncbi:hypothetical protein M9Y10_020714 [Tritrichomonas musculus]|uniref:DUF2188 domain-containing protein n=1 Tax=Tritrichomonas musculus TaxID=1915356 RepID=A0ABR2HFD0_9EUKA